MQGYTIVLSVVGWRDTCATSGLVWTSGRGGGGGRELANARTWQVKGLDHGDGEECQQRRGQQVEAHAGGARPRASAARVRIVDRNAKKTSIWVNEFEVDDAVDELFGSCPLTVSHKPAERRKLGGSCDAVGHSFVSDAVALSNSR